MPVFLCFYARLIFLPPFRAQKETEFFRKQVMIHGLLCLLRPIPRPVAWSFCPGRRCIFPLYPPAKLGSPTGHILPHAFQPIPAPGRRCIASLCPLAGLGSPTGHIPPHAFQPIPAPGRRCIFPLYPSAGLGSPTGHKTKKTDLLQSVFFVSWYM